MGRTTKHRAFTYKEKKFNQLGKSGLIEYFKPKFSPEKIQDMLWEKHKQDIKMTEAKRIARVVEKKEWEENEEQRLYTITMVDMILYCGNLFNITNLEAFAMTCHVYKAIGGKKNLTQEEVEYITERTLEEVNRLRLEDWDAFMRILKEVS